MAEETKEVVTVDAQPVAPAPVPQQCNDLTAIGGTNADDLIYMAEKAEEVANAIKKIVRACFAVTTVNDWVLIGGVPYLTESGTTKVGNLIGISFEIVPGFPQVLTDSQGYKTYIYRVRAFGKSTHVEGEGSRSMREDFFRKAGKDKYKQPEEIKERDVMIAALTNAKNNAIKSIIPGLKNVTIDDLQAAKLDLSKVKGYTFKEGAEGGAKKSDAQATGLKCECCGKAVTQNAASYSQAKYNGHIFCYNCDHDGKAKEFLKNGVIEDKPLPKKEEPKEEKLDIDDVKDDELPF